MIALNTNTYHAFSFERAVQAAVKNRIGALELSAVRGWTEHAGIDFPKHRLSEMKAMLNDSGLVVPVLSAHSDLRDLSRRADFVRSVDLAVEFGCNTIVTSSDEAHPTREEGQEDALYEGLIVAQRACADAGIALSLETHGNYGSGEKLARLIDRLALPIGITYDTANVIRHGKVMPEDDLPKCAELVRSVHLKDRAGLLMDRIFPALGHGWIDFNRIFAVLDSVGFDGCMSIEIEYFEETPPLAERVDRDVSASVAYLREIGRFE